MVRAAWWATIRTGFEPRSMTCSPEPGRRLDRFRCGMEKPENAWRTNWLRGPGTNTRTLVLSGRPLFKAPDCQRRPVADRHESGRSAHDVGADDYHRAPSLAPGLRADGDGDPLHR